MSDIRYYEHHPCPHGRWLVDCQLLMEDGALCPGGLRREITVDYEPVLDAEKVVAVTLRREFPDLLPTTDAWRPIAQRACQVIAQRLDFDAALARGDTREETQ